MDGHCLLQHVLPRSAFLCIDNNLSFQYDVRDDTLAKLSEAMVCLIVGVVLHARIEAAVLLHQFIQV